MYKLIFILIFFLTGCNQTAIPPEDKTVLDNYYGEWTLPKDFKEFNDHSFKTTNGKYTKIKVTGTDLIAGISPRFYMSDYKEKIISCRIDIKKRYADNKRSAVLAEINVPLENLDIKTIKGDIENIISVQGHTIIFNLGKETFEYTLNIKKDKS